MTQASPCGRSASRDRCPRVRRRSAGRSASAKGLARRSAGASCRGSPPRWRATGWRVNSKLPRTRPEGSRGRRGGGPLCLYIARGPDQCLVGETVAEGREVCGLGKPDVGSGNGALVSGYGSAKSASLTVVLTLVARCWMLNSARRRECPKHHAVGREAGFELYLTDLPE